MAITTHTHKFIIYFTFLCTQSLILFYCCMLAKRKTLALFLYRKKNFLCCFFFILCYAVPERWMKSFSRELDVPLLLYPSLYLYFFLFFSSYYYSSSHFTFRFMSISLEENERIKKWKNNKRTAKDSRRFFYFIFFLLISFCCFFMGFVLGVIFLRRQFSSSFDVVG